jgi:hypothetical protein
VDTEEPVCRGGYSRQKEQPEQNARHRWSISLFGKIGFHVSQCVDTS